MKREEQIEFLAKAKERAGTRAREWQALPSVKAAAKAAYLATVATIREVEKKKANG